MGPDDQISVPWLDVLVGRIHRLRTSPLWQAGVAAVRVEAAAEATNGNRTVAVLMVSMDRSTSWIVVELPAIRDSLVISADDSDVAQLL
jgi:hypothetical protein